MRIIRAIFRYFFNRYYNLHIKHHREIGTYCGWDWVTNFKNEYIGYVVYGYHGATEISMEMNFDKPYMNRDYAVIAMMIHWRLYCHGYKMNSVNQVLAMGAKHVGR